MASVTVVGSGPSGVHFAITALAKGHDVTIIDVGKQRPTPVHPNRNLVELKNGLPDPVEYFLGKDYEGVLLPEFDQEYYGFPPSKQYVFANDTEFVYDARGFEPLMSFARGGLAEAWTGGCYPFNDAELDRFPFTLSDLIPYYGEVARRIGISGDQDDLTPFMPLHEHIMAPLPFDEHSAELMRRYGRKRAAIRDRLGCHVGRTRVATLSADRDGRTACSRLGRCLWGCPTNSLYTPSITLQECLQHPRFKYVSGVRVNHFVTTNDQKVTGVVGRSSTDGSRVEIPVDTLVLAAGALSSSEIFLRSLLVQRSEIVRLSGLMDNRQVLIPFVNLSMVGKRYDPATYQYHLLGLGIETDDPAHYIHGQITTLTTALMHPIIQKLPLDLRTATFIARQLHAALGVVNLNLHDTRRAENTLTLQPQTSGEPRLSIEYAPPGSESGRLRRAIKTTKRFLRQLGCVVPPGMMHVRPMGASVHYAGTVPMASERRPFTTNQYGQSHDYENLIFADGATFPFLPAKNLTFTLMANAVRIADRVL